MNIERLAQSKVACPRCSAAPGSRCTTTSGAPVRPHSARSKPLYEVWRDGYGEGARDLSSHALEAAKTPEGWQRYIQRAARLDAAKGGRP